MNLPVKYTEKELQRAKDSERLIGWVQGAGAVVAAAIAWNLLGWIPLLLFLVAVGWVVVKVVSGSPAESAPSKDEDEG